MNGAFGTDSISPAASSPLRSVNRKKPTPLSSNSNDLSAQPPTLLYTRRTVCPIEQEIKLESSVVEFIRPKTVGPCCRNESNKTQRVFYFQIGFALFAPFMYYEQRGLSICKWAAPVVKRYTHTGNGPSFRRGWRAVSKARGMVIIVKCDSEWHRHAGPPPRSNPPSLSPPPSLQMRGWS